MTLMINNIDAFSLPTKIIGGKAKNLALLSKYNVPKWFVLSTEVFDLFLKTNSIFDSFYQLLEKLSNTNDVKSCSEQLKILIKKSKLPQVVIDEIQSNYDKNKYYAIRSSAVDEDGKENSFAGIMDSFLFQSGIETIEDSIKKCFISCFSHRALTYRLDKKISIKDLKIAVIIQEMVMSEKSGVLFSANPTNGQRDEYVISANFGLGEGVVNGECEADEYIYSSETKEVNSIVKEKDFIFIKNENSPGSIKVEIDAKIKNTSTLTSEEISKLVEVSTRLVREKKFPQDIEWAFYKNELYILQTRDITSLLPPKKSNSLNIVFDNSNIQESYCGVTTPLTFSYANEAYFRVYHQMLSIMGLKEDVIRDHEKRHWNMISFIRGRVYYNINSWYEGLLLFPSFNNNKDSMEKMMGLQDPVDFITDKRMSFSEKIKLLPTVIRCYWNLIKSFIKIDALVNQFCKNFEKEYIKFDRSNFCFKEMGQLFDLTDNIINNITAKWQAPIINDFYVMTYHGKALRMLEELEIKNPQINLSNLLSGEEGIQSTEPTKQLLKITDLARKDSELKYLIETKPPLIAHETIIQKHPGFYTQIQNYIEMYGDRVIGELKLESISLREDPSFMYKCIKTYLDQNMNSLTYSKNEKVLRIKTEADVFDKIKSKHGSLKLKLFKSLLDKTRKGVKHRENMRLIRTRVFGLSRDLYLEIGRQLQTYGFLESYRDIFYLTLDELERFRMGRSVQTNFKDLIASRKDEYSNYENDEPAYHFHTSGPVYLQNSFTYPYQTDENADLIGLGCYPGIVKEEVVKMTTPDDISEVKGKILCTMRTDPGWAPIFPMIKGLIVERGSMLSHSAVIARELGIPTIVGIKDITKKLETGTFIQMDGEKGTIEIINS